MRYVESPFLHKIPMGDGYTAFYNSLNMELAFVRQEMLDNCEQDGKYQTLDFRMSSFLESMQRMELLIPEESDGYDTYHEYVRALNHPSINILYLLLTDACNLRCKYCYFLANFGLVQKWLILGNSSERMSTIAEDWR